MKMMILILFQIDRDYLPLSNRQGADKENLFNNQEFS